MMGRQKWYVDFGRKTKPSWLKLPSLKHPGVNQGRHCPHEIDGVCTRGVTTHGVSKLKTLPPLSQGTELQYVSA